MWSSRVEGIDLNNIVIAALGCFMVTVIIEGLFPQLIGTPIMHPIPFEWWVSHRIYAAPALPSLIAFGLLIVAAFGKSSFKRKSLT
jgi:hypothetical protein